MKPFISTTFYGFFNFILAFTMMASPWLFGFVKIGGAALFIPLIFGWIQFIMAVFADNKASMIRQFPMQTHLVIDMIMGFILFVSPFLYSFYTKGVFVPHLLMGIILMILALVTKRSPFTGPTHRSAPEGSLTSTASNEGRLNI